MSTLGEKLPSDQSGIAFQKAPQTVSRVATLCRLGVFRRRKLASKHILGTGNVVATSEGYRAYEMATLNDVRLRSDTLNYNNYSGLALTLKLDIAGVTSSNLVSTTIFLH